MPGLPIADALLAAGQPRRPGKVPITMVNLLDERRDWFRSCVGLPLQESPATTSFCEAFFAEDDEVLMVEDTLLDPRFSLKRVKPEQRAAG